MLGRKIPIIAAPCELGLRVCGIWPFGKFKFLGPMMLIVSIGVALPSQCWETLYLKDRPLVLMDSLTDIIAELFLVIKLIILWTKKGFFKEIITTVYKDWTQTNIPKSWKKYVLKAQRLCKFDLCLYLSAVVTYYPEIVAAYLNNPPEGRKMLFKTRYPFDMFHSPSYEIVFLCQATSGLFMVSAYMMFETFTIVLVLHVGARINSLRDTILSYSDTCPHSRLQSKKKLKLVWEEHAKIMKFAKLLNEAFSFMSLVQVVGSILVICLTGFVIITSVETDILLFVKFMAYILAMLWQAFTFCFAGEYLKSQSLSIPQAMWNSMWYKKNPDEVRALAFMLKNANKSMNLSGGGVLTLSMERFTKIIKTSASFLSVLRAMVQS